jgi:hypothetical protein
MTSMMVLRRALMQGMAAAAASLALLHSSAMAEPAPAEPEPVVLARTGAVVLAAQETHVVLKPVPARRRAKAPPRVKGAKPAPPRMQLVLRDVVGGAGAPAYEVFLVLEGPNVFEAKTTRISIGMLPPPTDGKDRQPRTVVLDAAEAFARFAKIRGFNSRHLRVALVRQAIKPPAKDSADKEPTDKEPADKEPTGKDPAGKDTTGKDSAPIAATPPEIGAIELVRT